MDKLRFGLFLIRSNRRFSDFYDRSVVNHSLTTVVALLFGVGLIGCNRAIDFSEHRAEVERREREKARSWPEPRINQFDQAQRRRVLAERRLARQKREERQREAEKQRLLALRKQQLEQQASKRVPLPKRPSLPGLVDLASIQPPKFWEGQPPEPLFDEPLPEGWGVQSTAETRSRAEELVAQTSRLQELTAETEKQRRVFARFEALRLNAEARAKLAAQREEEAEAARAAGVGELTQIETPEAVEELKYLFLRGPEIDDQAIGRLAGHPHLKLLHLQHAGISDQGLAQLARIPHLRLLVIEATGVSEAAVNRLQQRMPDAVIQFTPPVAE